MHISVLNWMCSTGCWFNSCLSIYLPSSQKDVFKLWRSVKDALQKGNFSSHCFEYNNLFAQKNSANFLAVQEHAGTSSAFFGYSLKIGLDGHLILQGARTAEPKSFLGADGCSLHQTSVVLKLVFIFHLPYRKCL